MESKDFALLGLGFLMACAIQTPTVNRLLANQKRLIRLTDYLADKLDKADVELTEFDKIVMKDLI